MVEQPPKASPRCFPQWLHQSACSLWSIFCISKSSESGAERGAKPRYGMRLLHQKNYPLGPNICLYTPFDFSSCKGMNWSGHKSITSSRHTVYVYTCIFVFLGLTGVIRMYPLPTRALRIHKHLLGE